MSRRQLPSLIRVHCERRQVISRAYLSRFNARYYNGAFLPRGGRLLPPRPSSIISPPLSHPPQVLSCARPSLIACYLTSPSSYGRRSRSSVPFFFPFFVLRVEQVSRHASNTIDLSCSIEQRINEHSFPYIVETFAYRIRVYNKIVYNGIRLSSGTQ